MCFDARFLCYFWLVAFRVTFNNLSCCTKLCGLLSRIQLVLTNQSWQTGPNESVSHFEVVFVVCWHQIGKLMQVVWFTIPLFIPKLRKSSSWFNRLIILKQIFQLESISCVYLHDILKNCWQRFVSILWWSACLDLMDFGSLSMQRCGLLSRK